MVFSVLNHNPFNPPKPKAEGATIFRNTREVNTYRQVGNNFHTILRKPTNQPTHPTTTECCLVLQKGPGFSLLCLLSSSMLPPSQVSSLLPVCLFCCLAPTLQAFTSKITLSHPFSSLFALLTDTSSGTS